MHCLCKAFEHPMSALSLLCVLGAVCAELFPIFIQVQVATKKKNKKNQTTHAFLSLRYLRINSVRLSLPHMLFVPWFTDLFHCNFLARWKMGQFRSCSR